METVIIKPAIKLELQQYHYESFDSIIKNRLIQLVDDFGIELIDIAYNRYCPELYSMDSVLDRLEYMFYKLFIRKIEIFDIEELYGVDRFEIENLFHVIIIDEDCYIFHPLPF